MRNLHNRPLAALPLTSYRYLNGAMTPVMIGATDVADALGQAARSIARKPCPTRLQVWNGTRYVPACPDPAEAS